MKRSCIAAAFVCLLAGRASATVVTYQFAGTVNGASIGYGPTFLPLAGFPSYDAGDTSNLWGALGQPVSGSITLDSSVADTQPGDPTLGNYPGVILSLSIDVGGTHLEYDASRPGSSSLLQVFSTTVTPAYPSDGIFFSAQLGAGTFPAPRDAYTASVLIAAPNGLYLGSDAFAFSLEPFTWDIDVQVNNGAEGVLVTATQTRLHYVPEPGTELLVAVGGLAVAARRQRSRSARG